MAREQRKVGEDKDEIIGLLPQACRDERIAVEFVEAQRWGDAPACPRCGDTNVYQMLDRATSERSKRFLWRCRGCKRQFTVRVGTIFEDSPIPMRIWCHAFWRACSSKKGVSALQIKRETGLTYKSALFMMHRIRFAMAEDHENPPQLSGTVEVDETYVGGRTRIRNQRLHGKNKRTPKETVVAMVERGGRAQAEHVSKGFGKTIKDKIRRRVDASSTIMTDESFPYRGLDKHFAGGHHRVQHSIYEYARGPVSTNTVEGFFSLLKRGIYGTFHHVSPQHLHRYVAEFEFRYNARALTDGARTQLAIRCGEGKRLASRTSRALTSSK
jgi:transposase-like protein